MTEIRKEILDLGKELNEHLNNEMKIVEKVMKIDDMTLEESKFLINKTMNHEHNKKTENLFDIDTRKVLTELLKGKEGKFGKTKL